MFILEEQYFGTVGSKAVLCIFNIFCIGRAGNTSLIFRTFSMLALVAWAKVFSGLVYLDFARMAMLGQGGIEGRTLDILFSVEQVGAW